MLVGMEREYVQGLQQHSGLGIGLHLITFAMHVLSPVIHLTVVI